MSPTSASELSREAIARLQRDLEALSEPGDGILVAVSGGPDSLALLFLAQAALGERMSAATVDHGLRPESADEAVWVAKLCAARGIRHAILRDDSPAGPANLSARAREMRYRLLEEHARTLGGALIATAHHADDQVETIVMRLNRGAGLSGLAGVRARNGNVIRPLLGWRRAELAEIVAAEGITAIDDPSNTSDRFDRARLRKALAGVEWLDAERIATSAAALGDAEQALLWALDRIEAERIVGTADTVTLQPDDLPFEFRRRLVERCVRRIDPAAEVRGPALAETVRALESGKRTMLGNVLCDGGPEWRFSPAPARRNT